MKRGCNEGGRFTSAPLAPLRRSDTDAEEKVPSFSQFSELMNQLDTDKNEHISWQEWSHGCAVWLHQMGQA